MNQRKPWLPTVILAGIAILVIAFSIWIVPLLQKPPESEAQPTPVPLWEFNSSELVLITVVKDFQTTTVERSGMAWQVVAPTPGEADIIRLYNLADTIANMSSARTLDGTDLTVFGLAEPAATVILGLQDGTTLTLTIGDQNPGLSYYYVQKEGDSRVHLVASAYISGLLDLVDNPPYPATATPPPSPEETPTPGESPVETPATEDEETKTTTTAPAEEATGTPTPEAEDEEVTETATTAPTEEATETVAPDSTEEPTGTPTPTSTP
ncbi:MAG: DUF4340 domain-containing protein [Anaerolineae bacterium]